MQNVDHDYNSIVTFKIEITKADEHCIAGNVMKLIAASLMQTI